MRRRETCAQDRKHGDHYRSLSMRRQGDRLNPAVERLIILDALSAKPPLEADNVGLETSLIVFKKDEGDSISGPYILVSLIYMALPHILMVGLVSLICMALPHIFMVGLGLLLTLDALGVKALL